MNATLSLLCAQFFWDGEIGILLPMYFFSPWNQSYLDIFTLTLGMLPIILDEGHQKNHVHKLAAV